MSVGAKIHKHRKELGLSQVELAEKTGLSLRTIQRIEKERNVPRGYTLRVLAEGLDLDLTHLAEEKVQPIERPQRQLEMINLSVLTFLIVPFGNLIFPVLTWQRLGHLKEVDELGRRVINFQITWSIITYSLLAISPFVNGKVPTSFPIIFMVLIGAWAFNIYCVMTMARKIKAGDFDVYKVAWKFF